MEIPKFHETFIPILKVLSNGKVVHHREMSSEIIDKFYSELTKEQLEQKTKSGDTLILNRIAWGKSYLKKGGFIEFPKRGMVKITEKRKNYIFGLINSSKLGKPTFSIIQMKIKTTLFLIINFLNICSNNIFKKTTFLKNFCCEITNEENHINLKNITKMRFEEIINEQRKSYIKQLIKYYENRTNGIKECLMELNSESETLLFNLSRIDYIVSENEEYKIEELTPENYINHQKLDLNFGGLNIELNPFFWHGCELIIKVIRKNMNG